MSTAGPQEAVLYGNWRKAKGFGIGQLGPAQSIILFVSVMVPIGCMYVSPKAALLAALGSAFVLLMVVVRVGGSTAADVIGRRFRFMRAKSEGWTELSGGVLTDHPRGKDLPGPMAPIVPLETDDGRGGKQGLLWDRRVGFISAVIRVSPVGVDLADKSQADAWVASWGSWLADLGYQPLVRHIAVTVDTAPTGGTTVRDYVNSRLDPGAPLAAQQVLRDLVEATPAASSDVDTRVTITFDPSRANPRPKDLLGAVAEITRWLPGIERSLNSAGVAVLGRATTGWLVGRLRVAYDPAARVDIPLTSQDPELLHWAEAGPLRASESWFHWRHDSGISVSWALQEAPRQAVVSRVLTPLLSPGRYPRRVTMLYQPFSAEQAAAQVEKEINNLQLRSAWAKRTKRDETQRDKDDRARAVQAAQEEAQGAGLGSFCMYVTTTIQDEEQLPSAIADVEQRAGQCKLRLRRLNGAQSAGFAGALGLGINPAELARRNRNR